MAGRIKGITVEINGDTTKLSKALQNVDKSIKNTQTQLKDVEKLLKLDPTNTELLAQKQKLLGQAVQDTKTRLDTLKKASEEAAKTKDNYDAWKAKYDPIKQKISETETKLRDLKGQSKTADEQLAKGEISKEKYDALQREIKETSDELSALKQSAKDVSDEFGNPISPEQYDALQREIVETQQELQNLQTQAASSSEALAKLGQVGETLEKVGGKIADVGETLTTHVTVPILAAGTAAVKTASDFDTAMSKVAAVSGAAGDELDALRDKAREMGAKTKFSASEAAEAMNYMAMAGWKTTDMLDGIEGVMNLAAASGEGLATTSDIVTDALTAFGLQAEDSAHFADVLAAASSNANTNVSMMGETFKYCAPIAGSLGFSCEDTAEAIGLMANAGIKSTQAGTALRSIMTALAGEVKICGKEIGTVEIATSNADGSMRNLTDILADTRDAFSRLSESEQASAAKALVGKNAMSGFLALLNAAPEDIEKLESAISTCSDEIDGYNGVTEKMAAVMQDNLGGQITILKSQLQELAISFGEILMPAIRAIVSRIQGLVDKLNQMDPAMKEMIVKIALIAAAIGPLLVVVGKTMIVVGQLMQFISNLPTIIAGAKSAFAAFSGAIGGISAPVVAVIAIVAALVAAFVHLWRTNEDFRNKITGIWEQIKGIFQNFCQGIVDRLNVLGFDFKDITEVIKAVWDGLCQFLAPVFEGVFQQVANIFKFVTDTLLSVLDIFIGIFTGDWDKVWNGLKGIFLAVWNFLVDTLNNYLNVFCNLFGTDMDTVAEFWVNVWNGIKDFFVNLWTNITTFCSDTLTGISDFFTSVWTGIRDFFVGIWTAIYNDVTARINLIKAVITFVWNAVYTAISTVLNAIWTTITTVWQTIYDFISPLLNAFRYLFETIFMAIQILIGRAMDWIHEKITAIWNAIVAFLTPILESIRSFFETVWNAICETVSTVLETIRSVVETVWNAVSSFVSTILNAIWSVVQSIWNSISAHISAVLSAIQAAVSNVWSAIYGAISSILAAILSTVTTIWENVKSAVSQKITAIKDTIVNGFNAAVSFIKGLASQAFSWGADIINGIRNCIGNVADAVRDVADTIRSYLHFSVPDEGPLTDFESWMPDFLKGLADGLEDNASVVTNTLTALAQKITETVKGIITNALKNILTTVSSFMTQVISTIRSIWNEDGIKTIDAVLNAIQNAIKSKVDSAWTWGRDMMQNLINGIRYMYNAVVGEIMNVASAISEYLHFSVPDKGPLSKFETWMPDFMKGLADGINKSKKYVETAVSGVADAMQLTMQSGLEMNVDGISGAMINGGTQPVINNYTTNNNQTFNQTNNSPKAVNRYEIYRQTKNLIHTVKTGR